MVFLSHLHADHAAGVRELPKHIPYVIQKVNILNIIQRFMAIFWRVWKNYMRLTFKANRMPPLGLSADLLGDGSLWAIHTPGHTHGMFLLL